MCLATHFDWTKSCKLEYIYISMSHPIEIYILDMVDNLFILYSCTNRNDIPMSRPFSVTFPFYFVELPFLFPFGGFGHYIYIYNNCICTPSHIDSALVVLLNTYLDSAWRASDMHNVSLVSSSSWRRPSLSRWDFYSIRKMRSMIFTYIYIYISLVA